MRKKVLAAIMAVFILVGGASVGAGWTWDEDGASAQSAPMQSDGPHEGGEI